MDDSKTELSDPAFLPNSSIASNSNVSTLGFGSASVDSILDEFLKHAKTCTHTHTCNPPGPDAAAHTYTCYHTHTRVFPSEDDTKPHCKISHLKPRKPLGNREAVRKYREKKKAHTAFLEEEVRKLQVLNQHLVRKLQGQAALEVEILSLRVLLVNLSVKIDTELVSPGASCSFEECGCDVQHRSDKAIGLHCPAETPCFGQYSNNSGGADEPVFSWQEDCRPAIVDCHVTGLSMVCGSDKPLQAVESVVSAKNQHE